MLAELSALDSVLSWCFHKFIEVAPGIQAMSMTRDVTLEEGDVTFERSGLTVDEIQRLLDQNHEGYFGKEGESSGRNGSGRFRCVLLDGTLYTARLSSRVSAIAPDGEVHCAFRLTGGGGELYSWPRDEGSSYTLFSIETDDVSEGDLFVVGFAEAYAVD